MQWSGSVRSAVLGGALGASVYAGGPAASPPAAIQAQVAQQVAQQTALLERIVAVLERWDAADQGGTAAAEARQNRAMQGWGNWTKEGGLEPLPKSFF